MAKYLIAAVLLLPLLAAGALACIKENKRWQLGTSLCVLGAETALCAGAWALCAEERTLVLLGNVAGFPLKFMLTPFQGMYLCVAAFMFLAAFAVAPFYFKEEKGLRRFCTFSFLTFAGIMGVLLSGDFYTLLLGFELASLASYMWVIHEKRAESLRAGETYLFIAVAGGLCMLMGVVLLQYRWGTTDFEELALLCKAGNAQEVWPAAVLLGLGFAAKAGLFPLHIWLPKAHTEAPAPASALLSGMLTKTGIFGLILLSRVLLPQDMRLHMLLLQLGTITMVLGGILGIFATNIKRILACSSVSQIGFITLGIAAMGLCREEAALPAAGVALYMLNHSLVKTVLFLNAGIIYRGTGSLDLNRCRGFGRNKPVLHITFLLGMLSLCGVPGFLGYIGKTLLHESLVAAGAAAQSAEWLFLLAGGLTLAYMLKLYIAIFVEQNERTVQDGYDIMGKKYISHPAAAALIFSGGLLAVLGFVPKRLALALGAAAGSYFRTEKLNFSGNLFSGEMLLGILISFGIGTAVYLLAVRTGLKKRGTAGEYPDRWPKFADLENTLYRPVLIAVNGMIGLVFRFADKLPDALVALLRMSLFKRTQPRPALKKSKRVENALSLIHTRSFSMGLLASCLGICAIMLYVLLSSGWG